MKKSIRIANGQGFWGDSVDAPRKLLKYGKIDYLTLDYLAEVTLSIMQMQKMKDDKKGYALDFIELIDSSFFDIVNNKIKIITNAGGVNPRECAKKIIDISKKYNKNIRVAVVTGDDIMDKIEEFNNNGCLFKNMDTNENFYKIKDSVCSANVYINSFSIKKALSLGADIVLCGRVSDPGLALGPMLYEFGWNENNYDKLASGTLAGHIIECGAQCTGGNYSRWEEVDDISNIGYPIIEIDSSGDFNITKPENSGGLINKFTILEQVLYEMGDPSNYISPDVVVDFTSFNINDHDNNKVSITNVKGKVPTSTYKISINYIAGYKASGQLTISAPKAIEKAEKVASIIWERLKKSGCKFDKTNTEYLGLSSCHKDMFSIPDEVNELVLKLTVRDNNKNNIIRFSKEIAPVITNGLPGITGFASGRPKVQPVISFWPTLIDKNLIKTHIEIL